MSCEILEMVLWERMRGGKSEKWNVGWKSEGDPVDMCQNVGQFSSDDGTRMQRHLIGGFSVEVTRRRHVGPGVLQGSPTSR